MTDPVDLLRRAATKLREHANAATAGPWREEYGRVRSPHAEGLSATPDGEPALLWARKSGNSEYATLMHPPVALALANLLQTLSWFHSSTVHESDRHAALAVARAVLREPDPTGGATDG